MTLVSWCSRCQENDFKIQMALSLSRNQDPLTRDNPPCCEQFHVGTIFFPCRRKWAFKLLLELIKLTKQTNITAQPRRMTLMFTSRTTAYNNVCGLSWVTSSLFLERDIPAAISKYIISRTTSQVPSSSIIYDRRQTCLLISSNLIHINSTHIKTICVYTLHYR